MPCARGRGRADAVRPGPAVVGVDVVGDPFAFGDHIDAHYRRARADGISPPTAAVLVRRNADAAPIADALRARR
ncbi:hypothetical protein MAHJHV47_46790 [Mycobacterium avium subsp. hominissuis]